MVWCKDLCKDEMIILDIGWNIFDGVKDLINGVWEINVREEWLRGSSQSGEGWFGSKWKWFVYFPKSKDYLFDFWNKCTYMGVSITSIGLENSAFFQYPKNE